MMEEIYKDNVYKISSLNPGNQARINNKRKIVHYWNYKGQPYKQGYIEKFNRTIQEEFIDQNEMWLDNVDEFNEKMLEWIMWYNTKKFHWSLNLMTPVDYLINNDMVSNVRWTNICY
ncbi:integrase core domain-containing protein [Candidatus Parcubacteria bacterium]|nr:integrase core domain-containing protein [Candidatus Parcubacteria bacterium]